MSLSYDEGFHIYIDGTETEKVRIADAFLGCRIPAGRHDIRVKYISPGFKTGITVFALSLILSIVWLILNAKAKPSKITEKNISGESSNEETNYFKNSTDIN